MRTRLTAVGAAILFSFAAAAQIPAAATARHDATPAASTPGPAASCDAASVGTPMAGMTDAGMTMGTPMAGMEMGSPMAGMAGNAADPEFDQLYIDMMIPHHESILAMAEVALTRLQDERLREIATSIAQTQLPEIEELRGYRARFYGDPAPQPMDGPTMGAMDRAMPGTAPSMEAMDAQMDAATQVALFCAAADPDLAFIDLTIPHHEGAVVASEAALAKSTHAEIRAFAERVARDQQREIDLLAGIRQERYGSATPEPVGS